MMARQVILMSDAKDMFSQLDTKNCIITVLTYPLKGFIIIIGLGTPETGYLMSGEKHQRQNTVQTRFNLAMKTQPTQERVT